MNDGYIKQGIITKVNLDREWALGQFCHRKSLLGMLLTKGRAEIAHYFYHWRYHLREQVSFALSGIGYLNEDKKNYIRDLPSDIQDKYTDFP